MRAAGGVAMLGLLAAFARPAAGQVRPSVALDVRRTDGVEVLLSVRDLLATREFTGALASGFPLYMEYRLALREPRSLWDRTVDEIVWEYVVVFDPVRERYVVETPDGTEILPDEAALARRLARVYVVRDLVPAGRGRYYYAARVEARTLSDADVDEAFAWLKGDNGDSARLRNPGLVTRVARRMLMQVAPLPRLTLEARTAAFDPRR